MAVIVENRLGFGILVIQAARVCVAQQEVFVDERHQGSLRHYTGCVTTRLSCLLVFSGLAMAGESEVTFHKDVFAILEMRCIGCHRPGEIGPMALVSYSQTKPWAKAIREAVLRRSMPPWHADRTGGHAFRNDRSMTDEEIRTLMAWGDGGAKEGGS